MRELTDAQRLSAFMRRLGWVATKDGRVYLTGGATAVLFGWRPTTADVQAMLDRSLAEPAKAHDLYDRIEPDLYRYPSIDPKSFRRKVDAALGAG